MTPPTLTRADSKAFVTFSGAALPIEALGSIAAFSTSLEEAVKAGHLDIVKMLVLGANAECPPELMDKAAALGHEDIVRFLHRTSTAGCTRAAMDNAAENGHLAIVQFLHFNRTEGCTKDAVTKALAKDHVDIMKFLCKYRKEKWGDGPLLWAVDHDDLGVIADILRLDPNYVTVEAKQKAYADGKLELMKYMYEHGTNARHAMTLERAADKGDLEMVRFLVDNREGFLKPAMKAAVCNGHLEIVKYIHQHANDTPTSASRVVAMNYAALNGHLDVLKYLHENAPELGCSTFAMDTAAARGHLDVVKFLHENRTEGCTTKAMEQAAAMGHLDVVKYLHENRTEGCSTFAMNFAAIRNHPEVVKFLHENRTEGCTRKAFDDTAVQGLTDMVKLLLELRPDVCDLDNGIRLAKQRKFQATIDVLEEAKAKRAKTEPAEAPVATEAAESPANATEDAAPATAP